MYQRSHVGRRLTEMEQDVFSLNVVTLAQFVIFTLITCPPNCVWQQYLEERFPGYHTAEDGTRSLHVNNTAKKFGLDQTVGSVVNVACFIAFFAFVNGKDTIAVQRALRRVSHDGNSPQPMLIQFRKQFH